MKHLEILVKANLVLIERRGRERFNFLNPAPLLDIVERWVSKHTHPWLEASKKLKAISEEEKLMNPQIAELAMELTINAPAGKVWSAMTDPSCAWWPDDFKALPRGVMSFTPIAGGSLLETNEEGGSTLWGTVVMVDPGKSIDLAGPVTPAFGGPNLNFVRMAIEDRGEVTLFRLTNTIFGNVGDTSQINTGWEYLFGGLKAYCEA